jgi:cysteine synthase
LTTATDTNLENAVKQCRELGIVVPTFAQMREPTADASRLDRLTRTGLSDPDPINLFRITWKNEPVEWGGRYNNGNWIEFPPELTGVPARIVGLVGRHFPTGSHKVGAAFGCLVPRLITGRFDPTRHKAVWPSTGNFCRGGVFVGSLLGCRSVAVLPEEMSAERFRWLEAAGADIVTTPGGESNVKEIYDEVRTIRDTRPDCVIFNQFEEFGNAAWHYHVTGPAVEEIFGRITGPLDRLAGFVAASGSAGTLAAGDYLRARHPSLKVTVAEALQCPTLLRCGFGEHRIEGIGDKHVPWIHNVRNTDVVVAVDDERCLALMRFFAEHAGRELLVAEGVGREVVERLDLLGISSICNLVAAIKVARYFEMDARDLLFVPLTDSMELYGSRIDEARRMGDPYGGARAAADFARHLQGIATDNMRELGYHDRKAIHHLKYFTWVEQQGKTANELARLWDPDFWTETFGRVAEWDSQIAEFNRHVASRRYRHDDKTEQH